MAIVKMKKLKLFAAASEREKLLHELMLLGCVEISEPPAQWEEQSSGLHKYEGAEVVKCRTELTALVNSLNTLKKYAPEKTSLLSPLPTVALGALLDESGFAGARETAGKILELDDRVRRIGTEEVRKQIEIESLAPWKALDLPLAFEGTETSAVVLGSMPASQDFAAAQAALSAEAELAELYQVSADKRMQYLVLVCFREQTEAATAALRPLGFTPVSLGDVVGTANEAIASCERDLQALAAEKEKCTADIAALASERDKLKLCADNYATKLAQAEAEDKLYMTETVVCLEGWVPAEQEGELEKLLGKYDCAWETSEPAEEEIPEVPVKLKNGKLAGTLNMVTEMYSLPAYDGVDPNPLMAPFFILFYGMMMADMGYGLVMMILGLLVTKLRKPKKGMMKYMFELMFVCGISTFIWGAVTGGFFGDAPLQVAKILNPNTTWQGLPAVFTPLNDTILILIGAMCLGFVQIVTGMAISFVEKLKRKEYLDAIFEEVTWWLVFAGGLLMAAPMLLPAAATGGIGKIVLIAGLAMIVIGPVITGTGFGKITGIFGSVYNHVTGYFGDILSYARLMALMLAGSVIAQVFNTIGAIPGNLFIFLLISLVGNTLNFALNLLGCFVHDLRLQCLEFFGKFYKDGGKPFRPLEVDTKFVNTVNE